MSFDRDSHDGLRYTGADRPDKHMEENLWTGRFLSHCLYPVIWV